jgi:hypothetical protein
MARRQSLQAVWGGWWLPLTHSDAVIELGFYVQHLVRGEIARPNEGAVMSTDMGYIAELPITECRMAITRDCVRRLRRGRRA